MARASKGKGKAKGRVRQVEPVEQAEPVEPVAQGPEHIIVEGLASRMQCFNLPHEVYCQRLGRCACSEGGVTTSYRSPVDNQIHLRRQERRFNSVLTVRYRQRVAVPRAALQCPEVVAALNARPRRLRVRS